MADLPKPVKDLTGYFERLPGIGPKSATRLAFYLINAPIEFSENFSRVVMEVKNRIKKCRICFGVGENEVCEICSNERRSKEVICVVERAIDLIAIENVGGYNGVYHVLGGVINPLEHIGPEDLTIDSLLGRIDQLAREGLKEKMEIIVATNPTMEGEATALYLKRKIEEIDKTIKVTRIGSGLPIGADLEFADQATLSRAMDGRKGI
jgi:recombination protein RecR